jgi:lysophospholipase L1-like esterase
MRLIAALTAIASLVWTAAVAPATAAGPLLYVALGDSYSAASGTVPPDPTAPTECARSLVNYPHDIANTIGTQLTDVTCGGAQTSDYFSSQYQGVAPQLDAVRPDTQLITMTIGGNDGGVFINAVTDCGQAGASTLGTGSPCKDRYGSSFDDTINNSTYPALVNALTAVRAKAPNAQIAILGYPWILPPTLGCYPQMPVATGDVPYLRDVQATLNSAVQRAAAAAGVTYVDMSVVSEGHDACQPIGVRWIEPALLGTNPVIVHPNALGEAKMAEQTIAVLGLG